MKKNIFICLLFALTVSATAQNSLSRDANVSVFGGYSFKIQNTNNNGQYGGIYADCPIGKDSLWNIGVWGLYSHFSFKDNLVFYKSQTSEMAGGLNGGYYKENFLPRYAFYGGLAVGYKYSREIGRVDKVDYSSEGLQTDNLVVAYLNLNLNKVVQYGLFPRTQLVVNWQEPFLSDKTLSENNLASKTDTVWNKGYCEVTLKQSICDILISSRNKIFAQPKLGFSSAIYKKGFPTSVGALAEISLKRGLDDDFFSVYCMVKDYPGKKTDNIIIGFSLNLMRLFNLDSFKRSKATDVQSQNEEKK